MPDNIKIYDQIALNLDTGAVSDSNACARCSEVQFQLGASGNSGVNAMPTAAQQKCEVCKNIKSHVSNVAPSITANCFASIQAHRTFISAHELEIKAELVRLNKIKSSITSKKNQIAALKTRIELKHSILSAYPGKIKTTMGDLNSSIAQAKLNSKDTVDIGLPFLPAFFAVTTQRYVVTCIGVSLLVVILIVVLCVSGFSR